MKGSIRERGDSYQIRISLGKDPQTGKYGQYSETVNGGSKDAHKRLRELLTELDKGTFIKPGKSTLCEYLKLWLADYCKPSLSPRTHDLYTDMCRLHIIPTLGNVPLAELKPTHLQHLYTEKLKSGLSGRTVQLIHITAHKALKNAVKTGLLMRNVCEAVDSPKTKHNEMKTMSESDIYIS